LRAGPGAVALDADRGVRKHVAQHRGVAVLVLVVLADALLEPLLRGEDVVLAGDPPAGELELGVVGEHPDEAGEVGVLEREQVARHEILALGAVGRVLVVVSLRTHTLSISFPAVFLARPALPARSRIATAVLPPQPADATHCDNFPARLFLFAS